VTVTIDGTPYLATNNGDGTWSLNLLTPIADGFHTLTAIGEDTLGNATTPAAMSSITITVSLATQPAAGARLVSTPIATTTTTQAADTAVTDAGIAANDAQTGEVLGEQTTTPNTDKNSDTAVKGDSTTKKDDGSNTWSLFGLAWYWWLLIVAAIAAGWWFLVARRRMNQE